MEMWNSVFYSGIDIGDVDTEQEYERLKKISKEQYNGINLESLMVELVK